MIGDLPQMKPGKKTQRFAGLINESNVKYTKRESKPFAILLIEDFTGLTEVMVWNETFNKCNQIIGKGSVVELKAKVEQDNRSEENRLTADEIITLEPDPDAIQVSVTPQRRDSNPTGAPAAGLSQAPNPIEFSNGNDSNGHHESPPFATPVLLKLDSVRDSVTVITTIREAAEQFPGDRPLHLEVRCASGRRVVLEAGNAYCVSDEFTASGGVNAWL